MTNSVFFEICGIKVIRGNRIRFYLLFCIFLLRQAVVYGESLDDSWMVSIGGQTVVVNADGSFRIPNVTTPDQFGLTGSGSPPDFLSDDFFRLTGVKSERGKFRYVWSQPFQIKSGETFYLGGRDLTFSDTPLVKPEYIRISTPKVLLGTIGETTQVTAKAIFPDTTPDPSDNLTEDVTPRAKFTVYRSSNPNVVTVGQDGLITARGNGVAIVTAVNSMVSGALAVTVSNSIPTTVEGFVLDFDEAPVVGTSVTVLGLSAVTDAKGHFTIPNVPSQGGLALNVTISGVNPASRVVTAVPGGISDAGIILLGGGSQESNDYFIFIDGVWSNIEFHVSALKAAFCTIQSPALTNPLSVQVPALGVATQGIDPVVCLATQDTWKTENKGIEVSANRSILPYIVCTYGRPDQPAGTVIKASAYTAIPITQLGTHYRMMTYPTQAFFGYGDSWLAVVATEDDTTVTVTWNGYISPFTAKINKLQAFRLTPGLDSTGCSIVANKPIAAYSGVEQIRIPRVDYIFAFGENDVITQLSPVESWGIDYVAVPFSGRIGGDLIRIVADKDNTLVKIRGGINTDVTINAGQFKEFDLQGVNHISSSLPIMIGHFAKSHRDASGSDPGTGFGGTTLTQLTPTAQFRTRYVFTSKIGGSIVGSYSTARHYVNIVAQTGDARGNKVLLDNKAVSSSAFTALANTNLSTAQIPVDYADHIISAPNPLGIYAYGFFPTFGYSYPGIFGVRAKDQ